MRKTGKFLFGIVVGPTKAEMDLMTDHELLSAAEKEMKHAKWALIVAVILIWGAVISFAIEKLT